MFYIFKYFFFHQCPVVTKMVQKTVFNFPQDQKKKINAERNRKENLPIIFKYIYYNIGRYITQESCLFDFCLFLLDIFLGLHCIPNIIDDFLGKYSISNLTNIIFDQHFLFILNKILTHFYLFTQHEIKFNLKLFHTKKKQIK